jgi:signal transduction histidine kinase
MANIAHFIASRRDAIIRLWTERAGKAASARGLSHPELQTIMPAFLESLAELGEPTKAARRELVEGHLAARLRQGFSLPEIIEELLLVGTCIAEVSAATPPEDRLASSELQRIMLELQETATAVTELFTQYLLEDQQGEKLHLRRLQAIAAGARGDEHEGGSPLRARLDDVLRVVTDSVSAEGGALLLPEGGRLVTAASCGVLEGVGTDVAAASFAERIAAGDLVTGLVEDVSSSQLPFASVWIARGIRSLLTVRLPARGEPVVGVLCVGRTRDPFTMRDARRLESLGDHLALLLDNAALYAALRQRIAVHESERQLRETFVSVLAHDLRGPLSVARVGASLLVKAPERLDERRDLAVRIVAAIDSTDRMVRDLLDANRIRAGERLSLRLATCDLADVVRGALVELMSQYGDRFEMRGDESVVGTWSEQDLRRVATNLGSNAAKYGDPGTPVTFEIARSERGARLSVHNEGEPLRPEILADPSRPFAREPAAEASGKRGWGLGLTLVKGTVEAHGGSITIDSARGRGTSFVIDLPLDARPFQSG